ncbi:hypothetical protein OS965_33940 [Streptomyces sp. H27-G5]|uniref:hypothetical protein n=1 Tax=Streptomyces sp. H27-G5 TaxID=2996698 RepID=UPI00226D8DCF|nr:hypothetical protein [Streptomyces sp. H27-G5]MCY0923087.1 hypothetical protein [Streptomyces sp. H27-G5]
MADKSPLLRRAEELVALVRAQEKGGPPGPGLKVHPETEDLLSRSRVPREQLNYAVPEVLELKQRLARYCVENDDASTPGNLVAGVLDAFLRTEGYPPLPKAAE